VGGIAAVDARLTAAFGQSETRITCRLSAETPLELRGPFRGALAGHSKFFLRNATAGIFGGDCYSVEILAGAGCRTEVTSSSATKVFAMPGSGANVRLNIQALAESFLVWGPHPTILQSGANLTQTSKVVVDQRATVLIAEVLVLGRLARGEVCSFHRFESSLSVERPGESFPLFEERYSLAGAQNLGPSLGGKAVIATVFGLGVQIGPAIERLRECAPPDSLAGFSELPNGAGLVARELSSSLSDGVRFCEQVIAIVVSAAGRSLGAPADD